MDRCKAANILLVEDNADHAELTLRALKNGNMLNDVFWVKDGEEALDFLYQRGRYTDHARAPRTAQLDRADAHPLRARPPRLRGR